MGQNPQSKILFWCGSCPEIVTCIFRISLFVLMFPPRAHQHHFCLAWDRALLDVWPKSQALQDTTLKSFFSPFCVCLCIFMCVCMYIKCVCVGACTGMSVWRRLKVDVGNDSQLLFHLSTKQGVSIKPRAH